MKTVVGKAFKVSGFETEIPQNSILIAKSLEPEYFDKIPCENVVGIIFEDDKASHTVIVARCLDIPIIVGAENVTEKIKNGDTIKICGTDFLINPADLRCERNYKEINNKYGVCASVSKESEIKLAKKYGAKKIGLLRTEFFEKNTVEKYLQLSTEFEEVDIRISSNQLETIMNANKNGNIRIIVNADDVEKIKLKTKMQVGAMIESKVAVIKLQNIVKTADFLCIGTSDLTADILKLSRRDKNLNFCEKKVIMIMKKIFDIAKSENCEVHICGEALADKGAVKEFKKIGYTNFCASPSLIKQINEILEGEENL